MRIHPRKRLDINWRDLFAGLGACATQTDRLAITRRLEARWDRGTGRGFACLSIRTGFDLLLHSLRLPRGSEILVSAITIPHMIQIIEHHGLVPVPVDLDMDRLQVREDLLEAAITGRTRAILIAHIFGSRMDLDPVAAVAQRHGLMLFEDCAQAFFPEDDYRGHPEADASMFSFGSIKTATALGGALFTVNQPGLLARMRMMMDPYPVRARGIFFKRLLKYALLKGLTDTSAVYGLTVRAIEVSGRDHDEVIMAASRGFSGPDFFQLIRQQPSAPLLALIHHRLTSCRPEHLVGRQRAGQRLASLLPEQARIPGRRASLHTWWLFPMIAPEGDALRVALKAAGFDATLASTSLTWVAPPAHMPWTEPDEAREAMQHILYLPLDAKMPDEALQVMAQTITLALQTGDDRHDDSGYRPSPRSHRPSDSAGAHPRGMATREPGHRYQGRP